ncbi:MAG: hypothetical protein ACYSVY_12695, partial [Planctomycetota bacterium]
MAVRRMIEASEVVQVHSLPVASLDLDLSSERWNLREGQASMVLGVDVIRPGGLRPDRGRKSLGVSLPSGNGPVVYAVGSQFNGRGLRRDTVVLNSLRDTVIHELTGGQYTS